MEVTLPALLWILWSESNPVSPATSRIQSTGSSHILLVRKRTHLRYPIPQPATSCCQSQNEHPSSIQSHSQQPQAASHKTNTPPVSSSTASSLMLPVTKWALLQYPVPQPATSCCQSQNEHSSSIQHPHKASQPQPAPLWSQHFIQQFIQHPIATSLQAVIFKEGFLF